MSSVLIFGKPNSGKTLLFNRLTGLRQKVANFPGVTVEIKTGVGPDGRTFSDYPGVYSFQAVS
ncbi:MAG: 50S ribosome-binding GTPase, partial [Bdellovibrionales bacterium]|nr:50S ribosome-binding GTPase [Bdellovibrionales bacterium]